MRNGETERTVDLGEGRFAHASGGLWLPDENALLLADVHLGYGWALRRRGQLGPVHDSAVERKLCEVVDELRPQTIVFVGDIVHAPRPAPEERKAIETTLRNLAERARLMLIPGNHDRWFRRDYADLELEVAPAWHGAGLVAVHGHQPIDNFEEHVVFGHIHPAIGVVDHAGASHKMPVFVAAKRATILPAFSPPAAGFDIRPGLPMDLGDVRVVVASGKRAVDLGPLARIRQI